MKKQKQSFKSLRVAAVSALAVVVLAFTGCPNGNDPGSDPGSDPGQGPGQVAPAVPITVTVTGIPSGHHNSWGELSLRHPETGGWAGGNEVWVEGPSASFAFAAVPGNYSLRLWLSGGATGTSEYFIASRNITAGANTIPFSAFTPLEQVSIIVTGIPNRYIGDVEGYIHLMHPGTFNQMSNTSTWISSSSATFTMRTLPGTYDVHLRFWYDDDWSLLRAYSAPSASITAGENTIPFSAFEIFEPITITVTGIPSRYSDAEGFIGFHSPGRIDWLVEEWAVIEGSSAVFTVFAMPGIYDISLDVEGLEDDWPFYFSSRRNITAGPNTIPFSAFSMVPQISITVTGISSQYIGNGNWVDANVRLASPGTENWVAGGWASSTDSSVRMVLMDENVFWPFNKPGTYDVHLTFEWSGGNASYIAPSRNVTAGNTVIPFGDFALVENGVGAHAFTATPEPSERATRSRPRARALSPRTR